MANLCAKLPVTVPPAPAPARLRAGPLPGGPVSRPPSQGGVGKGRARGEEQEEVGKKGTQWSSAEGRGALEPSRPPPPCSQTHFLGSEATFLHLGQAETVAFNWDSGRGGTDLLTSSPPHSLSPFLSPLFPSPFFPPFIGV